MKNYINTKHFKILELSRPECDALDFGVWDTQGYHIIDDDTNEDIEGNIYYVAVLNRVFNEYTLNKWLNDKSTHRHKEDEEYELMNYNNIKNQIENYGRNNNE